MKKALLNATLTLLTAIILVPVGLGQTIKFNLGPELKVSKRTYVPSRFVYGNANNIYLLRSNINMASAVGAAYASMFGAHATVKSTASLQIFDAKMNESVNKEFASTEKNTSFEDLIWAKDKFLMFTSIYDRKAKTNTAYGNLMDTKGNVNPKTVTLFKMEFDKPSRGGSYDFLVSDDSTKVLVYAMPPYDKKGNQKFAFTVYNNSLEKQWEKVVTLPYPDKLINIRDYELSNRGDVYILAKKYDAENTTLLGNAKETKKGETGRIANYKYIIMAYTDNGANYKEFTLDLAGKFVIDPTIKADPKGNLAIGGFYSEKFGGSEKGVFYLTIDGESKAVKTSSTKEFSKEMIDAFGKNRDERKNKGNDQGLSNFVFRNFVLRDDGGAVMLAENYYVVEYTYYDKYGEHTTYKYFYNDIIAVNIDPKGQIQWFARIPKRQVAGAPSAILSFSHFVVGDKIYLVYNDNKKNTGEKDKTKYFTYKDGVAVIVTIDQTGKVTKNNLFDLKDNKTVLMAQLGKQVTPNSMVVYTTRGKNYHLGTITVQ